MLGNNTENHTTLDKHQVAPMKCYEPFGNVTVLADNGLF